MTNYEELPTDVENELADFHANPNSNGRDSGLADAPDAKKKPEAIRVIADLIHASNDMNVGYDWHEVLEVELDDGRWVKVTLEEIADPTPEE